MSAASKRDRKRPKEEEEKSATSTQQSVDDEANDNRNDDTPVDAAWCAKVRETYDYVQQKHEEMVRAKGKVSSALFILSLSDY